MKSPISNYKIKNLSHKLNSIVKIIKILSTNIKSIGTKLLITKILLTTI